MSQRTRIATILSAGFVLATGICLIFAPHHLWLTYMSLAATTLLAAVAYTADPRPRPRGLRLVGNGRVLVRGLDEWTMYQYDVPFDRASSEQQSAALDHYKVGDRLFPARPQDQLPPNSFRRTVASFELLFPFVMLSNFAHGWHLVYLFVTFAASVQLLIWGLRRLSGMRPTSGDRPDGPI